MATSSIPPNFILKYRKASLRKVDYENKRFDFRAFLKEWGVFTLIISVIFTHSWVALAPVKRRRPLMDPTFSQWGIFDGFETLVSIDRFDIVSLWKG